MNPEPPNSAEDVFLEFVRRRSAGEGGDFEDLCRKHPALAEELRRLQNDWSRVSGLVERLREQPLHEKIERAFGSQVDPRIALEGDAEGDGPRASTAGALLRDFGVTGERGVRYRSMVELARGGMGVILKVWDRDLRRNLAMKRQKAREAPAGGASPPLGSREVARFLEEAQITAQLDHPGVVPVHELGLDEKGELYFTMRLVKGRDLRAILELVRTGEEGWNQTRALGVILRVCEAMAFAHERGVIHRDLKPANLMVGRHGEVYVMDWGLARVLGREETRDLRLQGQPVSSASMVQSYRREIAAHEPESPLVTMDGDVVGTPCYMSPEQAEGRLGDMGAHSDVFSLGAILYELLAGHAPYLKPGQTVSAHAVWRWVLDGPPPPVDRENPAVPPELAAICAKSMERDAARRYAHMGEMAEDLRAFLEHRVVAAYETGAWAEARKWYERNRRFALASAAGLLLLVGTLATAWVLQVRANERILQVSDPQRLAGLLEEADQLVPAREDKVSLIEAWIAKAEDLAKRVAPHRAALQGIRRSGASGAGASDLPPDERYAYSDADRQWEHDSLARLVLSLEQFRAETLPQMRERLETARTIRARSIDDHRAEWDAAIASIGDRTECPPYDGLRIEPQVGLVPIGRDPVSGFWEFASLESGSIPSRGTSDTLILDDDTGIVFVLVPAGTFQMGANVGDEQAEAVELPAVSVTLAPFFVSKHEMTHAQWERLTPQDDASPMIGALQPVGNVSWHECIDALRRLDLRLPTEAQWEYAARARASGRWSSGDDPALLAAVANLAEFDDGHDGVARVGSLAPNPFGLHDVHGNVWEWCLDGPVAYGDAHFAPADGATDASPSRAFAPIRGAASDSSAEHARCSNRASVPLATRVPNIGLRPVRALDP